ncbi:MAG TPA: peptidylprolyl isomerase [Kofleriaceae bacterium]|nr:peptidylprolyl isomerase [Kofleriaceae bacterium]
MRRLVAIPMVLAACSGSHTSPPPTRSGPPAPMIATTHDDVQVATVEGRPVWGSCVTAQAARGATRDEALKQCIDFELMAIEAEKRGLTTDRDVVLATRTALVSDLVAREYEDKYNRPEEFGTYWSRSVDKNRGRFDHPEARGSVYVRIDVPKQATPEQDAAAKQIADDVYAALKDERGLMAPHVQEIATRVIGTRAPLDIKTVQASLQHGQLDETYTGALFAIPEIGRVAPPVRTPWGWDVILLDSIVPAVHLSGEQLVTEALPDVKRSYFTHWVDKIASGLGLHAEIIDKNLPVLEKL